MMIWQERLKKSQEELNEILKCKERGSPPRMARICRECGLPCNCEDDCYQKENSGVETSVLDFSERRAFHSVGGGVVCEECLCR